MEEGCEKGKPKGTNPKSRGKRPSMQLFSLVFPVLGFRIRKIQKPDSDEDWERRESIKISQR